VAENREDFLKLRGKTGIPVVCETDRQHVKSEYAETKSSKTK
jgi:hypothetical protein